MTLLLLFKSSGGSPPTTVTEYVTIGRGLRITVSAPGAHTLAPPSRTYVVPAAKRTYTKTED